MGHLYIVQSNLNDKPCENTLSTTQKWKSQDLNSKAYVYSFEICEFYYSKYFIGDRLAFNAAVHINRHQGNTYRTLAPTMERQTDSLLPNQF